MSDLGIDTRDERIRAAQTAVIARMSADLGAARSTIVTSGRVEEGLACNVAQGKFRATLDLGPGMGGDAAGPSPGFHARAAIVGCVAIAIKMLAAREGVRLQAVDVVIETDFDDAALMGLGTGSAAPVETRLQIAVQSAASPEVVQQIVDRALAADPWFLALRDPQIVKTSLSVQPSR